MQELSVFYLYAKERPKVCVALVLRPVQLIIVPVIRNLFNKAPIRAVVRFSKIRATVTFVHIILNLFQIRKSSSSIYANIREANYGQSKADMLSKFEIALKECSETEGWLRLLFNTNAIDEEIYKNHRNLCGRIRRLLIASCKTLKEGTK